MTNDGADDGSSHGRGGTTKPIAYAPPPATPEERARNDADIGPLVTSRSGGTKPVAYSPANHDADDNEAQGYIVRGFSPTTRDSLEVPQVVLEDAAAARARFGDRAGEDKWLARREGVSAWAPVFVGFVLLDAIVATLATWAIGEAMDRAGVTRSATNDAAAMMFGAIVGLALALGAFHDRWRCVEAFSSRYVRGAVSYAWVPWIAGGYGVWRGLRKLRGR